MKTLYSKTRAYRWYMQWLHASIVFTGGSHEFYRRRLLPRSIFEYQQDYRGAAGGDTVAGLGTNNAARWALAQAVRDIRGRR